MIGIFIIGNGSAGAGDMKFEIIAVIIDGPVKIRAAEAGGDDGGCRLRAQTEQQGEQRDNEGNEKLIDAWGISK